MQRNRINRGSRPRSASAPAVNAPAPAQGSQAAVSGGAQADPEALLPRQRRSSSPIAQARLLAQLQVDEARRPVQVALDADLDLSADSAQTPATHGLGEAVALWPLLPGQSAEQRQQWCDSIASEGGAPAFANFLAHPVLTSDPRPEFRKGMARFTAVRLKAE
jgi:hypothetical protein